MTAPRPQGPPVQPAPVRMVLQVEHVTIGTEHFVRLVTSSQEGIRYIFLDPDAAEKVGKDMQDSARAARSGLQIVGSLPNGGPHA